MLLKVGNVEFSYGSFKALKGVTFEAREGEVVSVVGPNGSGKTTLLKTLDGIFKPLSGSVYVDGKSLGSMGRKDIAKLFGYVPQRLEHLYPFTVFDFVLSGRKPYIAFMPGGKDHRKVFEVLKLVNLEEKAFKKITELSGGELQRALIARALVVEPRILLLDEPTASLDLYYQLEVAELIKQLARDRRLVVVMALHDLSLAYRYSDKVVVMKDGKVYAMGSPEEALTEEVIYAVYGVRVRILKDEKAVVVAFNQR